jgi:hypothetical protein
MGSRDRTISPISMLIKSYSYKDDKFHITSHLFLFNGIPPFARCTSVHLSERQVKAG